ARTASGGLYGAVGETGREHLSNAGKPLSILRTPFVESLSLGLGLALHLAPAPIVIVFAGHCREHVEQHAVDGVEHADGEVVTVAGGSCGPGRRLQAFTRAVRHWFASSQMLFTPFNSLE